MAKIDHGYVEINADAIMKGLECSECEGFYTPPIVQCRAGHTFCLRCKEAKQLEKCVQCESAMTNIRCYTLEALVNRLVLDCKNKDSGCNERIKCFDIERHTRECIYRRVICNPFCCNNDIAYGNFVNHLMTDHNCQWNTEVWYYPHLWLRNNEQEVYYYNPNVIQKFDQYFLVNIRVLKKQSLCVSVLQFGLPQEPNKYNCEFVIGHPQDEAKRKRFNLLSVGNFRETEENPHHFSIILPMNRVLEIGKPVQWGVKFYAACQVSLVDKPVP